MKNNPNLCMEKLAHLDRGLLSNDFSLSDPWVMNLHLENLWYLCKKFDGFFTRRILWESLVFAPQNPNMLSWRLTLWLVGYLNFPYLRGVWSLSHCIFSPFRSCHSIDHLFSSCYSRVVPSLFIDPMHTYLLQLLSWFKRTLPSKANQLIHLGTPKRLGFQVFNTIPFGWRWSLHILLCRTETWNSGLKPETHGTRFCWRKFLLPTK